MELVEKNADFKAFKSADLIEMLVCLRTTYPDQELAIFLDNLSAHKSFVFTNKARELGIQLIYNIPYCPHLNGIEQYWNRAKSQYRNVIGHNKVNNIPFSNLDVVRTVLEGLGDTTACFSAKQGWKAIQNAQPVVDPDMEEEEEKQPEPDILNINSLLMQMN